MRKLVYYVAVTLDGYIAGPGGEFDFFPVSAEQGAALNADYPEFVPTAYRGRAGIAEDEPNARFDTVLMGRRTYEVGGINPYAHLTQYVVSTTLGADPDPAVRVIADDPAAFVRERKVEPGGDLWLCGGGALAAALLPEIDELILETYPVVAGAGVPMIAGGFRPGLFRAVRRREFDNGALVGWFTRA
ncbi:dihydrofolate reductase family protein [Nocardia sp. NPDC050697]|uniref:dihydrofolate reductase family protein n=1 Tax=Nocardia sp. NPDC050697 TaxID=3155158 RepID=UPI0033CA47DD